MRPRIVLFGAAVASLLSWVRVAGADPAIAPAVSDAPRQRSRLFVGNEVGLLLSAPVRVNGERVADEGGGFYAGFHAGYSHSLSERFGLMGLTRFSSWQTSWANIAGEERYRIDLSFGPEMHQREKIVGWHISAPLGVTLAQNRAGEGRAVQHSYGPGIGANVGLLVGLDFAGRHSGGYIELGWITHITWLDQTARLLRSGAVVHESYQYVDHALLFSAGYLYRL